MIHLHTQIEIDYMRKSCALARDLLLYLETHLRIGITTGELNDLAEAWTQAYGAISGPLNYDPDPKRSNPFPKSICTSINNVVCHGIPGDNVVLNNGDIVNIDVSPVLDGFFGDTSKTFIIGETSEIAAKLVKVCEESLYLGIEQVKPNNCIGDIGHAIQSHAEANNFSVVKEFVGHGINRIFHTSPSIPHHGFKNSGLKLLPGMIFTIEPMLNVGKSNVVILSDGWTAMTADNSLSAQFEHTVLVTESGVEILTK